MVSLSGLFERIGAPLANIQWSWGAVREDGAVFLRVWQDETRKLESGGLLVRLVNHAAYADAEQNLGYKERKRHVEAMQAGATGYAIFCLAEDPKARPRSIKSFNKLDAIRLGKITEIEGDEWAEIVERVPLKLLRV